jgi:hypothetical protein
LNDDVAGEGLGELFSVGRKEFGTLPVVTWLGVILGGNK